MDIQMCCIIIIISEKSGLTVTSSSSFPLWRHLTLIATKPPSLRYAGTPTNVTNTLGTNKNSVKYNTTKTLPKLDLTHEHSDFHNPYLLNHFEAMNCSSCIPGAFPMTVPGSPPRRCHARYFRTSTAAAGCTSVTGSPLLLYCLADTKRESQVKLWSLL